MKVPLLSARTCVLFLVVVVLGVYYPAIFSPFNSVDDPGTINYLLNADSLTLREVFTPGGTYYRPLVMVSFLADKVFWGLEESFMHLDNILFHLVNVLLLFAVVRRACRLAGHHSPVGPLVAALLFALHPINTESVNWISGRTDPLCCMFLLLAAFLMLRAPLTLAGSLAAAFSMLVACLAKETAIFFLPTALLLPFFLDAADRREGVVATARRNWPHLAVFSAAGAVFFLFRWLCSPAKDAGVARVLTHVAGEKSAGLGLNLKLPLKAAGFYLKKLVLPFPLNFGIIQVSDLYLPVGVLVCLVLVWLLTRRTLAAYFFLCAGAVSCSALMIPLLNLTWTPLAERYMYIPSAFFVTGCVLALQGWQAGERLRRFIPLATCLILAVAAYGSFSRTLLWQDNLALYQDTLKKSPGFAPAQNEIATALYARGQTKKAGEVMSSMQISANLINYQYGLITKATLKFNNGDLDGAEAALREILKDPGKHEVEVNRRILAVLDKKVETGGATRAQIYADSVRFLERLYQLTRDPFYLYRKGIVHLGQKERSLALDCFQQAARLAPKGAIYLAPSLKLSQSLAEK